MPSGNSVEFRFAADESTSLKVVSGTTLIVRDTTASNPAGAPSFEAVVFPDEAEADRINRVLRGRPSCHWLLTLNGKNVQLEFPGERGDGGISAGLFSSLDAALSAYSRTRENVAVEVESASEGAHAKALWAWREQMALWEIACNSQLQQQFKKSDPKSFERLRATLEQMDCSVKPEPPDAESHEPIVK
jgi:hypothetical protein